MGHNWIFLGTNAKLDVRAAYLEDDVTFPVCMDDHGMVETHKYGSPKPAMDDA